MPIFKTFLVFLFLAAFSYSKPVVKKIAKTEKPLKIEAKSIARETQKPINLSTEYPEFFGEPKETIERLNKQVQDIWKDDQGCPEMSGDGYYTRLLKAAKITPEIIQLEETADYSCPGSLHPDNYIKSYFISIADGAIVNFWEILETEQKNKLLNQLKIDAKETVPESCKTEIENFISASTPIEVRFNAGVFSFSPSWSYAQRSCQTHLVLTPKELLDYFKSNKTATKFITSLSK